MEKHNVNNRPSRYVFSNKRPIRTKVEQFEPRRVLPEALTLERVGQ